jgi:glycosyltransferase involved in cell wall biosynthesis
MATTGERPVVDVAVPTIGTAPYLGDAVASVMEQSLRAWRLVVSEDDGRAGQARAAVEPFLGDPRVIFTVTAAQQNAALHKTRLISAGTAPYVAILDNDDRWHPEFLERRVKFLERHPECAFVFSRSRAIDARGNALGVNEPLLEGGVQESRRLIRHLLRIGNVITSSSVVVRRSAYDSAGASYDSRFVVGYDYEMWMRLASRSPVGFLNTADVDYRFHPSQVTEVHLDCEERVQLLDHIEGLLAQALPDVSFSSHYPGRRRALCLLGAALDAAERGDKRAAWGHLRRAYGIHLPSLVHPAVPAVLVTMLVGRPAQAAVRLGRSYTRAIPRPLETRERAKARGHSRRWRVSDGLGRNSI